MSFAQSLFLLFLILPILGVFSFAYSLPLPRAIASVSATTVMRLVLLLVLGKLISSGNIQLARSLIPGYPLELLLYLDGARWGFLLAMECCFLVAHWISYEFGKNIKIVSCLLCLFQLICTLFIASENIVVMGALLVLAATTFFYLLRFSSLEEGESGVDGLSRIIFLLFSVIGILLIAWGIVEFGDRELHLAQGSGSVFGKTLWILILVLSVPLSIWSRWFHAILERAPEGIALTLMIFLSALTLKISSIFGLSYPDLEAHYKLAFYCLGIVGCVFSVAQLFGNGSRRKLMAHLPGFFLSLVLVSLGVSTNNLVRAVYYICLFVPIFTGFLLYASSLTITATIQKVFMGGLIALTMGLPGTPVYIIFASIGARSMEMGISYTIVFGLLWFLYFAANIHLCRRIFMDIRPPEMGPSSTLTASPPSLAGYYLFLMVFVIVLTHIAGGLI